MIDRARIHDPDVARHSTDPLAPDDRRRTAPLALVEPGSARRFTLASGRRVLLGSARDNEIVLADRTVSAHHAVIEPDGVGGWVLLDTGSTNGTFVQGARASQVELRPGLTLGFGRAVLRVIEDRAPTSIADQLGIVGVCPAMARVRRDVLRYAPLETTVLVRGETGTGKEVVARALHAESARSASPLVAFNAAALDPHLVDSELFGHERGAFTGAHTRRRGLFEQADGGTLFIDEVAELTLAAQARLLRVLESGELRPVGTERSLRVRVRVLAATHRDLVAMVRAKSFRVDLYYRLNALVIELPPLRERIGDVHALATHLLSRLDDGAGPRELHPDAITVLERYPWPGNVRQLLHVLQRASVLSSATIIGSHAVVEALRGETDVPVVERRRAAASDRPDEDTIRSTYEACDGRLSPAARQLGMPRTTLRELVRKLGIASKTTDRDRI